MSKLPQALWFLSLVFSATAVLVSYIVFSKASYPTFLQDEWVGLGHYFDLGFWPSIFCQHNQHIVIIPKLVSRLLYLTTDANPFWRGFSSLLTASLYGVLLGTIAFRALWEKSRNNVLPRLSLAVACLAAATWLASYQQLFWGMATHTYFSILFGMAAIVTFDALDQKEVSVLTKIILPALLAALSSFSFSYGVASWGGLAILMLFLRKPLWMPATTLLLGLALFFWLREAVPACDSLQMPIPTDLNISPKVLLLGLATTHGALWTQSLSPLLEPSIIVAAICGCIGLLVLAVLTRGAVSTLSSRKHKVLVAFCWLASGMLLLVSIGRSPAFVEFPSQMIAVRFLPLSIFFWICLVAATCCRLYNISGYARLLVSHLLFFLSCYILLTTVLTIPWLSTQRFGPGQYHFSFNEHRLEAIRTWVSSDPSQRNRSAFVLSFVDIESFVNNVDELRARGWDFFADFPSEEFPSAPDDLLQNVASSANTSARMILSIDRVSKDKQTTWTVYGSLPQDFPVNIEHIFLSSGNTVTGYAVTSPFQAYKNTPRNDLAGITDIPARVMAAGNRLLNLLRPHRSWMGIGTTNLRPRPGDLHCYRIGEESLLCK